ncbi:MULTISPECIES: SpoIIE family protein phosphatase/ATP-binding protein [unclassified Streptomyces]|uniref:SpoIIE family protein phosphatase/ATP-binding protein n=1 Tax=unclassified Streptomyces TaxID=2593676 RepID=UPI001163846D|nr:MULTISPECIES: SpoIIE family protein phosphatase/ATP-binding protein [unclassified Streptomyces]QDN54562.1 SpoIIE family protein phosphatase [Streptomyces sp. S1D4-20]QDN64744.1 SpoIIE family protein phosphatase [Streptomyces sp. S1D4-14]QDO47151.1 SpoIIE family protein phosphatase [Streptomyces sp. RLB3-5]QDO57392.1 SpoIIE family protein phosphatase [Streptomyces sp. RLB1-8]
MHQLIGRMRSRRGLPTVAGQVFLLQAILILALAAAAVAALMFQYRGDAEREARTRSLAVASAVAASPTVREALSRANPTVVLQPQAEETRRRTAVDFVVVMSPTGIRYTHPNPAQIGRRYIGNIAAAQHGRIVTETTAGTLGPSVRTVVPVTTNDGRVIGLVSAGITVKQVSLAAERQVPLVLAATGVVLSAATGGTALISRRLRRQTHGLGPTQMTRMYEHHDAVLHSVREGVLIVDSHGRLLLANDEARRLLGLRADGDGRPVTDLGLDPKAEQLLLSGRATTDEVIEVGDRLVAVSQRPMAQQPGLGGWVATLRDTTELSALMGRVEVVQERLTLLYDAGIRIGTTLDVTRTAQELAAFAVPRFADYVTVDLVDTVLRGDEPNPLRAAELRRVAVDGIRKDAPLYPPGGLIHFDPSTPQASGFGSGQIVLEADLAAFSGWQAQEPDRARRLVAYGIHSMIAAPLRARGVILGVATFWRSKEPTPFSQEDLSLAEELVARAAVSIENARRFTREHTTAVMLQRSLLPHALPEQSAIDVAHRYLPAEAGLGGVGGDWFDVIPLPGARVAIVVGDVVGHGLHAAATMGQLRTAVHNFSTLDLPPDELLCHLDELVTRIDQDRDGDGEAPTLTGATCLYAIYDPISRLCTMARAGHLEPIIVRPDGHADLPGVPAGPPLGLGGLPYEKKEILLPEGSSIVLYTDGLIEDRQRDIDQGIELLRRAVAHPGQTPDQVCRAAMDAMVPVAPRDDVALLVAGTRLLDGNRTASWDVPSDPSAVADVRAAAARLLDDWDMKEEAFTLELILSELVTNAIRHATGPIGVRLIRDRSLICEVSDGSSVSPHLRRATTMDEGGRGLFLVAQFADRWGTRYTSGGKVIWTEQQLSATDQPTEQAPPNAPPPT